MRHEFSMPCFTEIGLQQVETHEIECAVEIEPDEMVMGVSWYVSRVQVYGRAPGARMRWHDVHERNPLFDRVKSYALIYCADELAALWDEHCDAHPVHRMPDAVDEHGTYRAGAL